MLVDRGGGGDILAIGHYGQIRHSLQDEVQEVNLEGKFCVPGLVDAHAHMTLGGSFLKWLDLRGVTSREELTEAVKRAAENYVYSGTAHKRGVPRSPQGAPGVPWVPLGSPGNPGPGEPQGTPEEPPKNYVKKRCKIV